jgi:hypothetical protein
MGWTSLLWNGSYPVECVGPPTAVGRLLLVVTLKFRSIEHQL